MDCVIKTSSFSPSWCRRGEPLIQVPEKRWRGAEITRRDFLAATGAIAFASRVRRSRAGMLGFIGGAPSSAGGGNGFYPAGHWVAAQQPMVIVYPQTNTNVQSFARHLWMYSNSAVNFQNVIPFFIVGGALPYVWSISAAPAGTTIGTAYTPGGVGYGELICAPNGATFTNATFEIVGTGQDGVSITFQFTASTTQSTANFVFFSATGSDSNSGTYASPFQTLAPGFGSTYGTTTFPGATGVLMGSGPFSMLDQTSSPNGGCAFDPATSLGALIGFPGDSPVINISTSAPGQAFDINGQTDIFVQNLQFSGQPATTAANYYYFFLRLACDRFTGHNIDVPTPWSGTAANDNTSIFFAPDSWSGQTTVRSYIALKGITETSRNGSNNNVFTVHCLFKTAYTVTEFCSATGQLACSGMTLKASNSYGVIRYCTSILGGADSGTGLFACFAQNNTAPTEYVELCYNFGYGSRPITWNYQDGGGSNWFSYRNSSVGQEDASLTGSNILSLSFINEAVQYGANTYGIVTGTNITQTGCLVETSGIFNSPSTGDFSFISPYTADQGLKGAIIQ